MCFIKFNMCLPLIDKWKMLVFVFIFTLLKCNVYQTFTFTVMSVS